MKLFECDGIVERAVVGSHKLVLRDMNFIRGMIGENPTRKGRKQWERNIQWFNKYYSKPFWVQAEMFGDDDMIIQSEFDNMEKAREVFEELATSPSPNFSVLS